MRTGHLTVAIAPIVIASFGLVSAAPSAAPGTISNPNNGLIDLKAKKEQWDAITADLSTEDQALFLQNSTFDRVLRFLSPSIDGYPYKTGQNKSTKDITFIQPFVYSVLNILPSIKQEFDVVTTAYTNSKVFWKQHHEQFEPEGVVSYSELFFETWYMLTHGKEVNETLVAPTGSLAAVAAAEVYNRALRTLATSTLRKSAVAVIESSMTNGSFETTHFDEASLVWLKAYYGQAASSLSQIDRNLIQRWGKANFPAGATTSQFLHEAAFYLDRASNDNHALETLGKTSECSLSVTVPPANKTNATLVDLGFSIDNDTSIGKSIEKLVRFDAFVHWSFRLWLEKTYFEKDTSGIEYCVKDAKYELLKDAWTLLSDPDSLTVSAYVNACRLVLPKKSDEVLSTKARFYGQNFFAPLPYAPRSSAAATTTEAEGEEKAVAAGSNLMSLAQEQAFAPCDTEILSTIAQGTGMTYGQIGQSAQITSSEINTSLKPTIASNTKAAKDNAQHISETQLVLQDLKTRLSELEKKSGSAKALVGTAVLPLSIIGAFSYLVL